MAHLNAQKSRNSLRHVQNGVCLVVTDEQLLLYTVFHSGQTPSVILTLFEAIMTFKSLTAAS